MPIPTAALPHRVTIEPYEGQTAEGPSYGDPVSVRARVVSKRAMIRTSDGREVTATASVTIRPGRDIPAESRVTHGTQVFTVLDAAHVHELRGPYSWRLLCDGPRGATP